MSTQNNWTLREILIVAALGAAFGVLYLAWVQVWLIAQAIFGPVTTELGLGSARGVSLSEAREAAEALRRALRDGTDPRSARLKPTMPSFGEFADTYVETMKSAWRSAKHARQWETTLAEYAAPLREKLID